jgi:hypothetical protein
MKVTFTYDKKQDIWCLLTYGKDSVNSSNHTSVYEQLLTFCHGDVTEARASLFIDTYISDAKITIEEYLTRYQNEWDSISEAYTKIAERVFGVSLPHEVTAYLTINNRCPYSIEDNFFFVTVPAYSSTKTAMHELWHFYTWYAFGKTLQDGTLDESHYNEIKEALTVLLNIECKELLPEGVEDRGYPQHQALRNKIVTLWKNDKNIKTLWDTLSSLVYF